ncbi:hypothetical protein R1sor_023300 [Riccia sorocarpa]|uniref:YchJ-like middle NTF2-like domain-containing protein n=1 Tax=Riccia sorocarpa TaxID=122646 RepID=A0ABD3GT95_9MARC
MATMLSRTSSLVTSTVSFGLGSSHSNFLGVRGSPAAHRNSALARSERNSKQQFQLPLLQVAAEVKGFGKVVQKTKRTAGKSEKPSGEAAKTSQCPCGGGEEKKLYTECCGRYHGGVIEPDAQTLMKARFSAYALGVVPYVVRTTHPKNPDFEGVEDFAADVKATCERLRFLKLETLEFQEESETEASVSFIVTYSILKGGRGERKFLKEKSLFVKENERWFYRDRETLSQASEAAWLASTTGNFGASGNSRKGYNKGTTKGGFIGSSSGGEPRAAKINVKNKSGAK